MTAHKVKPVSGTPVETPSSQTATPPIESEGRRSTWCLPSGQPLVEFALSGGLLAPGLLKLAEAHEIGVSGSGPEAGKPVAASMPSRERQTLVTPAREPAKTDFEQPVKQSGATR
jgi:hypothetical protein